MGDSTRDVSWADVFVILTHMSDWDVQTHLLASAVDVLNIVAWQNGGGKQSSRPKPLPRPTDIKVKVTPSGDREFKQPLGEFESGTFRGVATPIDELNEWLGWSTDTRTTEDLIVAAYSQEGATYKSVAKQFSVSASTVGRIIRSQK